MDQFSQPSFVPKKIVSPVLSPRQSRPVGLLFVIAMLLFLASGAVYLGAYAYGASIERNIAVLGDSLAQKKNKFEVATLVELSKTDSRLSAARDILEKHRTLVPLFELLDYYTLQSVRFRSFKLDASGEGKPITIELTGDAAGYASIALQSDEFSKSGKLSQILFSELDLDDRGRVVFLFSAVVDPSLLSYTAYIESLGAVAPGSLFNDAGSSASTTVPNTQQ